MSWLSRKLLPERYCPIAATTATGTQRCEVLERGRLELEPRAVELSSGSATGFCGLPSSDDSRRGVGAAEQRARRQQVQHRLAHLARISMESQFEDLLGRSAALRCQQERAAAASGEQQQRAAARAAAASSRGAQQRAAAEASSPVRECLPIICQMMRAPSKQQYVRERRLGVRAEDARRRRVVQRDAAGRGRAQKGRREISGGAQRPAA